MTVFPSLLTRLKKSFKRLNVVIVLCAWYHNSAKGRKEIGFRRIKLRRRKTYLDGSKTLLLELKEIPKLSMPTARQWSPDELKLGARRSLYWLVRKNRARFQSRELRQQLKPAKQIGVWPWNSDLMDREFDRKKRRGKWLSDKEKRAWRNFKEKLKRKPEQKLKQRQKPKLKQRKARSRS